MATPRSYPEALKEALLVLPEEGVVERAEVATLLEFDQFMPQFLEEEGRLWRGHSLKNKGWCVLLVVKATYQETPQVCFTTEATTTRCKGVFLRKLRDGTLSWVRDKFA